MDTQFEVDVMEKEKNFSEKVLVHRIDLGETPLLSKPREGDVILFVEKLPEGNRSVECFIHGDETSKFKRGETYRVEFVLVNWAWKNKNPEKKKKEIKYIKKTPRAVNAYVLTGEILGISESKYEDSFNAVIDCGIFAELRILKDQDFKVGDYIIAEGRLDTHLVDEEQEGDNKSGDDFK
jgi:hypothetical protein